MSANFLYDKPTIIMRQKDGHTFALAVASGVFDLAYGSFQFNGQWLKNHRYYVEETKHRKEVTLTWGQEVVTHIPYTVVTYHLCPLYVEI